MLLFINSWWWIQCRSFPLISACPCPAQMSGEKMSHCCLSVTVSLSLVPPPFIHDMNTAPSQVGMYLEPLGLYYRPQISWRPGLRDNGIRCRT